MDIHKNARLTPLGREHMVSLVVSGQTPKAVGEAVGVCPRTVRKWVGRYQSEGLAGLQDRSSRPHRLHRPTAQAVVDRIEALRRQRLTGQAIAAETGVSAATVSRILKRLGLNRLSALEPAEPPRRYQRDRPGELIHIDIKKLGKFNKIGHRITGDRTGQSNNRGVGWEFVHVCIDDASRIAFSRVRKTERKGCAIAFLKAAVAYYASLGITVERVMTTTAPATKPSPSDAPASGSACATSAPDPTPLRQTAKPNASSRPPCANGPMPRPMTLHVSGPPSCLTGCIDTTGTDLMAVSDPCHPSANSA
jgi:transposase